MINVLSFSCLYHFICCETRVLAKDLEGLFCFFFHMAKLVNLYVFLTVLFYSEIVHQGLNKENNAVGPLCTSPEAPHGTESGRGKWQNIFYCCQTCVRPNLALLALTPDQEVWDSKDQRHLRQMDTSHHSPESSLVMLTRSSAPANKSGQELGNQSSLICRQWLANSATKCTQH